MSILKTRQTRVKMHFFSPFIFVKKELCMKMLRGRATKITRAPLLGCRFIMTTILCLKIGTFASWNKQFLKHDYHKIPISSPNYNFLLLCLQERVQKYVIPFIFNKFIYCGATNEMAGKSRDSISLAHTCLRRFHKDISSCRRVERFFAHSEHHGVPRALPCNQNRSDSRPVNS